MNIKVRDISTEEINDLNRGGLNGEIIAAERKHVQFEDSEGNVGILYLTPEFIERLGLGYISSHCKMEYSELFKQWFVTISEDDYYNDPVRNPPKTIQVNFVCEKEGEQTEVWKNVESN